MISGSIFSGRSLRSQKSRALLAAVALFVVFVPAAYSQAVWDADAAEITNERLRLLQPLLEDPEGAYFEIFDEQVKAGWSWSRSEIFERDGARVLRFSDEEEIVGRYFGDMQTQRYEFFIECQLTPPYHILRQSEKAIARGSEKWVEVTPAPGGSPGEYVAEITENGSKRSSAVTFSGKAGAPRALTLFDLYAAEILAIEGAREGSTSLSLGFDTADLMVRKFTASFGPMIPRGDPRYIEPKEKGDLLSVTLGDGKIGDYLDAVIDRQGNWLQYQIRSGNRYRLVADETIAKADLGNYDIPVSKEIVSSKPMGEAASVATMTIRLAGDWSPVVPATDLQAVRFDPATDETIVSVDSYGGRSVKVSDKDRREALRATGELPVNDPLFKAMATKAVGDATSDREKAELLSAAVTRALNYQVDLDPLSVQEAVQAKRGDCSEHAALFATLARSIGLPARVISGWVYAGDYPPSFGYHAWNEVAIDGEWISIDPTWNESRPNATHVRCDLADGSPEFWKRVEAGLVVEVESFHRDRKLALVEANRLVKKYPDEATWLVQRAMLKKGKARTKDLKAAVDLAPGDAEFREVIAYELWDLGFANQAISALRKAAELSPENAGYWLLLSDYLYETDDLEGAREAVERLIQLRPNRADYHLELAAVYREMGDLPAARGSVERAFELWPDMAAAHSSLGHIEFKNEEYSAASKHYERAVQSAPEEFNYHYDLVNSLSMRSGDDGIGDTEDQEMLRNAAEGLEQFVAEAPDDAQAPVLLAAAQRLLGLREKADKTLNAALQQFVADEDRFMEFVKTCALYGFHEIAGKAAKASDQD